MSESVFDAAQFGANLHQRLEDNVVGFAYAIREHDASDPLDNFAEIAGAGGLARIPVDTGDVMGPGLAMTEYMSMEVASVSKPITAVAILKLLQDQIGNVDNYADVLRATLEQKMVDFLPADWDTTAPQVSDISIAQLLRHESGFTDLRLDLRLREGRGRGRDHRRPWAPTLTTPSTTPHAGDAAVHVEGGTIARSWTAISPPRTCPSTCRPRWRPFTPTRTSTT